MPATLRDRMAALVGDIDVDLDAEIDGVVAL
jgi:antitoxin PrlF